MKSIIIGLGNRIVSDDGFGPRASDLLKQKLQGHPEVEALVDVVEAPHGGMRLMELMIHTLMAELKFLLQKVPGQ